MKICLQLNCFANYHGQCVGDRDLALQLHNCEDWDDLPIEGGYPYDTDNE